MAAPANDDFANAIALTGSSGTVTLGDITESTFESGEYHSSFGYNRSVWWKYVATTNGLFEVRLAAATDTEANIGIQLGGYTGSAIGSLNRIAFNNFSNYDGEGGASVNPVYNSLYFLIESGTTYHIQLIEQGTSDTSAFDRWFDWRVISTSTWTNDPGPVTGTSEIADAMRKFRGNVLPTDNDPLSNRWQVPDGYNDNATTTIESDGLLFNWIATGGQSYLYYVDASDSTGHTNGLAYLDADTVYEIGFRVDGDTAYPGSQDFYFYWDEKFANDNMGFWMTVEDLGNLSYLLYFLVANDQGGYQQVATGWPIRVRMTYTDSSSTYKAEWSVDGGDTWYWAISAVGSPSNQFSTGANFDSGSSGVPAWSVKIEGWEPAPPPLLPNALGYYKDGEWHLVEDFVI